MNIADLREKLVCYDVRPLVRTRKRCEIEGCSKLAWGYVEWEFPYFRDYFCHKHYLLASDPAPTASN